MCLSVTLVTLYIFNGMLFCRFEFDKRNFKFDCGMKILIDIFTDIFSEKCGMKFKSVKCDQIKIISSYSSWG